MRRLQAQLRRLLTEEAPTEPTLDLDATAARLVQLAVFADQSARRPVSAALGEARRQAFHHLEAHAPAGP